MKTFLAILLLAFAVPSMAQGVRINTYAGYVFDDKVDSYYDNSNYYEGTIKGGFQWGAGIEFMVKPNYGVEILYFHSDTKAPMTYFQNGVKFTNFDLGINYIMLGGTRYFSKPGGKVEGFGGLMIGLDAMNLENPDNGNTGSKTKFAWGVRGGANIWATEKVGLKLQASLLSAVQSAGGGLYFGTGGGGAGISTYSSIYQWGIGGGLVFKIPTAK